MILIRYIYLCRFVTIFLKVQKLWPIKKLPRRDNSKKKSRIIVFVHSTWYWWDKSFRDFSQAVVQLWPYIHKLTKDRRTNTHDVYRTTTFNRSCNVAKKWKKKKKKKAYGAKRMSKQKTLYFNSRHPRHLFSAQRKLQHLRISWRNPCIWRLEFCTIIKSCSCFWIDHKSKKRLQFNRSISIDLWRHKVETRCFCTLLIKRGNL